MAAITCSCGAVIVDLPGLWACIQPRSCPDCDPEGYPLRWSCPYPPRSSSDQIGHLRRRVATLTAALADEQALADALASALLWGSSDMTVNPSGDRAIARYRAARQEVRHAPD